MKKKINHLQIHTLAENELKLSHGSLSMLNRDKNFMPDINLNTKYTKESPNLVQSTISKNISLNMKPLPNSNQNSNDNVTSGMNSYSFKRSMSRLNNNSRSLSRTQGKYHLNKDNMYNSTASSKMINVNNLINPNNPTTANNTNNANNVNNTNYSINNNYNSVSNSITQISNLSMPYLNKNNQGNEPTSPRENLRASTKRKSELIYKPIFTSGNKDKDKEKSNNEYSPNDTSPINTHNTIPVINSPQIPLFNNHLKIETPKYTHKNKITILSPVNTNSSVEPLSTRNNFVNNLNSNGNATNSFCLNSNNNGINVMSLLSSQHIPLTINTLKQSFTFYESSKHSNKPMAFVKAYSANTHQGTVRNYNEDRVSIILNIVKPHSFTGDYWPKCSVFGIYDGHGGNSCADYLRDNLHQFVIKDSNFPNNPTEAILKGFEIAEREFINNHATGKNGEILDRSGSCAIVLFIIDDTCYIANVGDSRGVLSKANGKIVEALTSDHKPNDENEEKRINEAGGRIYQTQTPSKNVNLSLLTGNNNLANLNLNPNQVLLGPFRVFPGRLSVSRTFGDVEAKILKYGGMPNVVIAIPEITSFKITEETDFVVIGCDGVYDQLSNKDISECVWMTTKEPNKAKNIHLQCALGVDMILKTSLARKTLDNVTCVMIAFENFDKFLSCNNISPIANQIINVNSNTLQSESPLKLSPVITGKEGPTKIFKQNDETNEKAVVHLNNMDTLQKLIQPSTTKNNTIKKVKLPMCLDENGKEYFSKLDALTTSSNSNFNSNEIVRKGSSPNNKMFKIKYNNKHVNSTRKNNSEIPINCINNKNGNTSSIGGSSPTTQSFVTSKKSNNESLFSEYLTNVSKPFDESTDKNIIPLFCRK